MAAPIPDYSKVSLLLPLSGADNGTVFTDYSPVPKAVSRVGDVKTRTAQSKYYGSSGYFDGLGDYLRIDPVADDLIGADPFTIEGWFYPVTRPGGQPSLFSLHTSGGGNRIVVADYFAFGSSFPNTFYTLTLPLVEWRHVAVVRTATKLRVFIGGTLNVESTTTTGNDITVTDTFTIGQEFDTGMAPSDYFNGYVQDVCVTKGEKYVSDFDPPARMVGSIAVETRDESGILVPRKVFAVPRGYPSKVVASGTTDSNGALTVTGLVACEHTIVALAEGDALPDLALRRLPT